MSQRYQPKTKESAHFSLFALGATGLSKHHKREKDKGTATNTHFANMFFWSGGRSFLWLLTRNTETTERRKKKRKGQDRDQGDITKSKNTENNSLVGNRNRGVACIIDGLLIVHDEPSQ